MKKRVVVTGGAGFIGSNLVAELTKDNEVIVIDDFSTGDLKNIKDLVDNKKIDFIKGSITDLALLQKTCKNVDYVFHEAAIASVTQSIKDPLAINNVNINGTLNVLVAARDNYVKKVVFASSCAIYGNPLKRPIKESAIPDPLTPYALSKLVGEYYCQVFNKIYNLSTVSLRYFNVYGLHQDPAGDYAAVIPKFINQIFDSRPPPIYGDGKQTRDFIFVADVVRANILAVERDVTGVFNIASGRQTSINDLANGIIEIAEKNIKPVYHAPRPGDIKYSLADISKIKNHGYEPKITLEEGLRTTFEWFSKIS
jgi:UDP-glucose 4-epimerase